jgi:hypothetical protein
MVEPMIEETIEIQVIGFLLIAVVAVWLTS